jgi:cytoskeletal protein CcmA (bactofilin family)
MAAGEATVIGRGTRVRGRLSGAVDLEVHGYVDGEIAVGGDVTIDARGIVGANVAGRRLVVRGAVKGDLTGEDSVVLEEGAKVLGDVRAPRVAIAVGALVKGYVQTGGVQAPTRSKSSSATASRPAARATSSTTAAATPKAAAPAPKPAPKAAPAPAARAASRPTPIALAGGRSGPPAPVVPALKKGAKGALKKKAH